MWVYTYIITKQYTNIERGHSPSGKDGEMTQIQIWEMLKQGKLMELHDEGLLDVTDLRFALEQGWIDYDTALIWGEILMDV